jgi:hypothetical protein
MPFECCGCECEVDNEPKESSGPAFPNMGVFPWLPLFGLLLFLPGGICTVIGADTLIRAAGLNLTDSVNLFASIVVASIAFFDVIIMWSVFRYSGTTAITALLKGKKLHVANVGDSRMVVCQRHGKHVFAYPLSSDQTLYRKDERERVKAKGAAVMTNQMVDGIIP